MKPLALVEACGVGAAIVLSAVLFMPASADPVNVVKLVAVLMSAILCLTAMAMALVRDRTLVLPPRRLLLTLGLLAGVLSAVAIASPSKTTALLGTPGRLSGLFLYMSCIVLAVSTSRLGSSRWIVDGTIIGSASFTALYGLLQYFGLDAVNWANDFNPIIATLGNPNFASAYIGIAVPLLAAFALRQGRSRVTFSALAGGVLLLGVATMSGSIQGPLAAGAGLMVVAFAAALNRAGRARLLALITLWGLVVTAVTLLAIGVLGGGPAARIFGAGNFETRKWYWKAAINMWQEQPLLGVGLDHYGRFWRTARPMENVAALGGSDFTDAAHSVPLHFLATGGVVAFAAYLLFVIVTGWTLMHGMRVVSGEARLRLGGVGGAWVAYQVQSLVSIDQVPLVVLNFVLAGAVVATSAAGALVLRLPGAPLLVDRPRAGRRGRRVVSPPPRATSAADVLMLAAIGILALGLTWSAFAPLRADLALKRGTTALMRGDGNTALSSFQRAAEIVPGRTVHWSRQGDLLAAVQRVDAALQAYDRALTADPTNVGAIKVAASLAEEDGQLDRARGYYRMAVREDPFNPATITTAATFELRHGGARQALVLLEQAVVRTPDHAALWTALGDARQVLGDQQDAIEAYERALSLDPTIAKATEELVKLRG
jgi:putative inorganic carbon (HCO3(-)) transporter